MKRKRHSPEQIIAIPMEPRADAMAPPTCPMSYYSPVCIEQAHPAEYPATGNRSLQIGVGRISGLMLLRPFVDPLRCSKDMGWTYLRFVFCDASGRVWTHDSLLGQLALFPTADDRVQSGALDFSPALSIGAVDDSGREFALSLDSARLRGQFSHTAFRIAVRPVRDTLIAHIRLSAPKMYPPTTSGSLEGSYQIPLERILWRKAALYYPDEIVPEEAPFVSVEPGSDAESPLDRSPVWLV